MNFQFNRTQDCWSRVHPHYDFDERSDATHLHMGDVEPPHVSTRGGFDGTESEYARLERQKVLAEGAAAFKAGDAFNPYRQESDLHWIWNEGWYGARKESAQ